MLDSIDIFGKEFAVSVVRRLGSRYAVHQICQRKGRRRKRRLMMNQIRMKKIYILYNIKYPFYLNLFLVFFFLVSFYQYFNMYRLTYNWWSTLIKKPLQQNNWLICKNLSYVHWITNLCAQWETFMKTSFFFYDRRHCWLLSWNL